MSAGSARMPIIGPRITESEMDLRRADHARTPDTPAVPQAEAGDKKVT
jgi:hypothetical protein